jgi:predicted N-acetyltransferase YhbS
VPQKSPLEFVFGTQARFVPPKDWTFPDTLQTRAYIPADHDSCVQIYLNNEPGRLPTGVAPEFELFLERNDYLKLVCCIDGAVTAVGGIGLLPGLLASKAWLVFGLVDPSFHGRGIGTALLLARLAALPRPRRPVRLLLSNVPGAVGFFARFGFELQGQMPVGPHRTFIDVCSAMLDVETWETVRDSVSERVGQLSALDVPTIQIDPRLRNQRPGGRDA